jgi:hypothetical protein
LGARIKPIATPGVTASTGQEGVTAVGRSWLGGYNNLGASTGHTFGGDTWHMWPAEFIRQVHIVFSNHSAIIDVLTVATGITDGAADTINDNSMDESTDIATNGGTDTTTGGGTNQATNTTTSQWYRTGHTTSLSIQPRSLDLQVISLAPRALVIDQFLSPPEVDALLALVGGSSYRDDILPTPGIEWCLPRPSLSTCLRREDHTLVDMIVQRAADAFYVDADLLRPYGYSLATDLQVSWSIC